MKGIYIFCAIVVALCMTADGQSTDEKIHSPNYFDCHHVNPCDETTSYSCSSHKCHCKDGFRKVEKIHCIPHSYTECDMSCNDHGKCYADGGLTERCYCDQSHVGDECETSRTTVTCNDDTLKWTVIPMGEPTSVFYGNYRNKDDEACKFVADGNTWTQSISLSDDTLPCHVNYHNDTNTYSARVVVFYEDCHHVLLNEDCIPPSE